MTLRPAHPPLTKAEVRVLDALVSMHKEFGDGPESRFTGAAVEHIVGAPVAGSLGMLASYGLVAAREQRGHGRVFYLLPAGREARETAARSKLSLTMPGFARRRRKGGGDGGST